MHYIQIFFQLKLIISFSEINWHENKIHFFFTDVICSSTCVFSVQKTFR